MNVVATSYFDTWANYQIGYDLLSTHQAEGYHTIRVYGVLNVTGNSISWSSGSATVGDATWEIGTWYGKGSYTLVYRDYNVYADANGHASFYFSGSINTTYKSGSCSGTAYLPDIPRYPVLVSGTNFKDTENPVFKITAYGNYPIRVKLEAGGNTSLITRNLTNKNSQTYTLELTQAERDLLRSKMTGDTLPVRETVCALQNGTEISWSYKDYTMTKGNRGARILVNETWKEAVPYVGVNGQWKEAITYIGVNNQWKEGI